jgi:putative sterol carrier protein
MTTNRNPSRQNGPVRYLSLEWIDALTEAVRSSEAMQRAAAECSIAVTQVVTGSPEGDITYHLQVANGTAAFGAGPAVDEDVRMVQDWDTAVGVAQKTVNPQDALIQGRIRLGGDPKTLMAAQPVFSALDAIFSEVSKRTVYDWPNHE